MRKSKFDIFSPWKPTHTLIYKRHLLLVIVLHNLQHFLKTRVLDLFGQLLQLFSQVKIQDLKVSLGLKILYIHYNILYIYNL